MQPEQPLPVGKLPARLLGRLLASHIRPGRRVVVGPGIGQDATVLDLGDRYLVAKTDPVTFAVDDIGWYAVHVNANDVACCGATPLWFLATLLLPERRTTEEMVERIFAQLAGTCDGLGITLCGGHTEITAGLDRPIVVGQMLGEVAPDGYVTAAGARVGDSLILTKGIAIEGTALLAREKWDELQGLLPEAELRRCAHLLYEPGISVVPEARLALETGGVHALHDPTEGGLATGLWELAQAAGVGLVVYQQALPILPQCQWFCRHFHLDPLGLIGSGALLIAAAAERTEAIVQRLKQADIAAAVIGRVLPPGQGCTLVAADQTRHPLPQFARDELARLFDSGSGEHREAPTH